MKFRKKPIVIEAMQWDGTTQCLIAMREFMEPNYPMIPNWGKPLPSLIIRTLEGNHEAKLFDWIIKGVKGEFYPCKADIFEETYEKVEE